MIEIRFVESGLSTVPPIKSKEEAWAIALIFYV